MAYTKKIWVDVSDPSNLPSIPEGQDSLPRLDADNMNRLENGISNAHDLLDGLSSNTLHNLGFLPECTTVLEAATIPSMAGYTFFAVSGAPLVSAEDSACPNCEVQYLVLIDNESEGARRTVIAYCYGINVVKFRRIYRNYWFNGDDWLSFVFEGGVATYAQNLSTLSPTGTSHGASYPMFCKYNLRGDNRFGISVEGSEVGVDHATAADTLTDIQFEIVSYEGTGKGGSENYLTFNFAPELLKIIAMFNENGESHFPYGLQIDGYEYNEWAH